MRRTALTCLGFASLALASVTLVSLPGCGEAPPVEHVIRAAQPIQGGTVDQGDLAVVGILIDGTDAGGLSLCSGSLIGPNLVLSAHHCVQNPPNNINSCTSANFASGTFHTTDFRVTTSYNAAAAIFNGGNPSLPAADGVTWFAVSSIAVPGLSICGQDMSALTLTQKVPSSICPLIPAVDTPVTSGEAYTAIGFGVTSPSGNTAGTRYKVTGMGVTCASNCSPGQDSATEEWEGGTTSAKGTCEGDSGGPAIDSLGRVIGTVSRGPSNACNSTVYESVYGEAAWIKQVAQAAASAGGYAAAGWVTGAATSSPTSGYCGGSSSSSSSTSSTSTSSTSSTSSSGGSSGGVPTSCTGADGGIGCCTSTGVLYYCSSTNKLTHQTCTAGTVCGWNAAGPYYDCVPAPGGADPSNQYPLLCGGTASSSSSTSTSTSTSSSGTTSSSSSSSGGTNCGFQDPTPACDSCLTSMCCAQEQACANDPTCTQCVTSATPPAGCTTNQAYLDFGNCYSTTCGVPCGASSSSSSGGTGGSAGSTSSSSGSGTGGSGTGTGTGNGGSGSGTGGNGTSFGGSGNGNGNSGTGNSYGGIGHGPGASSGCNVASSGGAPASPASFAGLLLGAALIVSRRRR